MRDFLTGITLVILALGAIFWLIPEGIDGSSNAPNVALSPAFWPYVIAYVVLFFSTILTIQGAQAWMSSVRTGSEDSDTTTSTSAESRFNWRMLIAVLLLAPYYYLALSVGLLISSILALGAYSLLAGEQSFRTVASLSLLGPIVLTIFFTRVAQVIVPLGPLKGLF